MNNATKYYWPNFWYHKIKVNVIPYDTKNRRPILISYKEYRNKRIPIEIFNQWLEEGLFDYGMAIFPGKIYSEDPNQILFLVVMDFDKKEGFEEFCKFKSNNMTRELWAERTILEQHPDNLDRAHMYFLSPIPFPNKGTDTKIGIEVKSRAEHGIIFSTNSPHKNGSRYQIQGTKEPWILSKTQAIEMIQHINGICINNGLEYVDKKVLLNAEIKKMIKNLRIPKNTNIKLMEGERHDNLIPIANSILFRHYRKDESENSNANELKSFFESLSEKLCEPESIPQDESDSIWNSCLEFVKSNKKFDNDNPNRLSFLEENKTSSALIEQATELILENNHFITLEETKEILYYENGVYVPGGDIIIEIEAERLFGFKIGNKHLSEIKGHIIRKTYYKRDELDIDLNIINLQNGLYNFRENKLYSHTPDYLSVNQKPIIYDPRARPRFFGNFLKDVLYPVDIRTAIEAIAYTFFRDTPFEHFFKLFGYGMNGKSVYTGIITELHGPKNVSNVSISELLENRFGPSDLEFKDVNIDTELSGMTIKDTSILKKLTGGGKQAIRIERKNQRAYDRKLHAKLFFNANILKETIDQTAAYYRREILISFPYTFEGTSDDPYLIKRLTSKEELSGIFNILMISLRNIMSKNGIYLNDKTVEQRRLKSERANDPVKVFLEEAVAEDSTADEWTSKADLHHAYTRFCNKYKLAFKSIEAFGKDLKRLRPHLSEGKRGKQDDKRKTCWLGLRLTPEYQLDVGKQQQITFSTNDVAG